MKTQRLNIRQEYSDIFEQLEKWGSFMLANVLWSIFAALLVPLPAATAALFAVMSSRSRGKHTPLLHEFFGAMRRYWLKSALIMLLNIAVIIVLSINVSIFPMMSATDPLAFLSRSVTLFAAIALALMNIYLWSLLVVLDLRLKQLIEMSVKLVFAYPLWSLAVLVAAVVPIAVSVMLPQAVFVLFTFSCVALIITKGTWRIIRQHIPEDQRSRLEALPHQG